MSERNTNDGFANDDPSLAGRTLARFPVPPERPRFFEELRDRMQEHDRESARRWRRVSATLAAVAAAAIASAAVLAATVVRSGGTTVVDRTISCQVQFLTTAHALDVQASTFSENPSSPSGTAPASVGVTTFARKVDPSDPKSSWVAQLAFQSVKNSLSVDRVKCRPSRRQVPFTSKGLTSNGTQTPTFKGGIQQRCISASRALIHYRIVETGGVPERAQVAVRNEDARFAPIAYIEWAPNRVTSYTESNCVPYTSGP